MLISEKAQMKSALELEKGCNHYMNEKHKKKLALFYCEHTPESSEQDKQSLEQKYDNSIRLFPIPCSGRIESLHLLRALEEFADAAYLIACPEGECRYFEGNLRANKRVLLAKDMIKSIGLENERIGIVRNSKEKPKSLARQAEEILKLITHLRPSPVHNHND